MKSENASNASSRTALNYAGSSAGRIIESLIEKLQSLYRHGESNR